MFHRIGAAAYKDNLDNTLALSKLTGHPEQTFPHLHIAGTNGKGSVSALLASILQTAGYKTALFTSPHLRDFRERIRVNGRMIQKAEVSAFVNRYRKEFQSLQPSFFEMTFALAMAHFAQQKPDIAVTEVGMGGRLDSTNIVPSILSVITNIGYDHMAFLGNTLPLIAVEKAGIIKQNTPVVIGETQSETETVFLQTAEQQKAPLVFADQEFDIGHFKLKAHPSPHLLIDLNKGDQEYFTDLKLPLGGLYQLKNTLTVMAAVEQLQHAGFRIEPSHIREGFLNVRKNTGLLGRWQVIGRKPLTICDTGHNLNGLREVVRHLRMLNPPSLHVVFGMVSDKDVEAILDILPRNARYYFCKPQVPRGLDAAVLADKANNLGLSGEAWPGVQQALDAARREAGEDELIFVGGSTFVVAEVV